MGSIFRGPLWRGSLLLSLAVAASQAHAGQYNFTKIADNTGPLLTFSQPTINNSGEVAYWAQFRDGSQGYFTNSGGGAPHTILTTHDSFQGVGVANVFSQFQIPINNSGTTCFLAQTVDGTYHILTAARGSQPIEYARTSGGPGGFQALANPWIGNSGDVSFYAVATDSMGNPVPSVYNEGNPVATFPLDQSGRRPHLNDTDNVVFTDPGATGNTAIYLNTVPVYDQTTAVKAGGNPTINNSNQIAFEGSTPSDFGIYVGNGSTTSAYATHLTSPTLNNVSSPDINNAGKVVFRANAGGIYDGPNPQTDTVVRTSSSASELFGSVLSNASFYRGLNDSGQIAFAYTLSNGEQGIALATPRDPTALGNGNFNNGLNLFQQTGLQNSSVVKVAGDPVLQMSTSTTPTGILELVRTSQTPYLLQFDYDWLTAAGSLAITANGQQVLSLGPSGVISSIGTPTLVTVGNFTRLSLMFTPAAFDPNTSSIEFDLNPGSLAQVQLDNLEFQPVPEPSSWLLTAMALMAVLCGKWRQSMRRNYARQ